MKCVSCSRWFLHGERRVHSTMGVHHDPPCRSGPKQSRDVPCQEVPTILCEQDPVISPHLAPAASCQRCKRLIVPSNLLEVAQTCPQTCITCAASVVEVQVQEGKALELKCPCDQHSVKYVQFRQLKPYLTCETINLYEAAHRSRNMPSYVVEFPCDECGTSNFSIVGGPDKVLCSNHWCGATLCSIHKQRYRGLRQDSACPGCLISNNHTMSM